LINNDSYFYTESRNLFNGYLSAIATEWLLLAFWELHIVMKINVWYWLLHYII